MTLTREQLYQKLWTIPATKLAADIGCSDALIAKVCKRHNIPKPYPGYWMMLVHGKNPRRIALPPGDRSDIQMVAFGGGEKPKVAPRPKFDADVEALLQRARELPPVTVRPTLSWPHPLVEIASEQMRLADKPWYQQTAHEQRAHRPHIAISASPGVRNRALRIYDAFIKRIEELGGTLKITGEGRHRQTVLFLAGEELHGVRLRERQRMVRLPPDPRGWGNSTELQGTGMLLFDTGGPTYSNSELLSDTPKHQRLESRLGEMIISFIEEVGLRRIKVRQAAEERRVQEEKDRLRRQRDEELRKKQEDLARRQREEQRRVDELVANAEAWQQSRLIRRYLRAVRKMLEARDGSIPIEGKIASYLAWAEQQADRRDPLRPTPPSVLDERV